MQSEFINCNSYLSNCSLKPLELKVSNFNILIDEKLQNLKKEGWEIKLLEDKSRLYYKLYLGILPHIKDSSNKMILSILLELNKKIKFLLKKNEIIDQLIFNIHIDSCKNLNYAKISIIEACIACKELKKYGTADINISLEFLELYGILQVTINYKK